MAGRLLVILLVPLGVAALVFGLARALARRGWSGRARAARVRSVAGGFASVVGLLVGLAFVTTTDLTPASLVAATAPALVATVMLLASTMVELTWPKPAGQVRVARIGARRPAAPRTLGRILAGSLAASTSLLVAGGLTATDDGRRVEVAWGNGSTSHGPWPGWYYGIPMGAALLVLLAVTLWSVRVVDTRPALGPGQSDVDVTARTLSKARVLRTACLGALGTTAPLAVVMGSGLNALANNLRMNESPLAHQVPLDWRQDIGFGLIGVALVCLFLVLVVLAWHGPAAVRVAEPGTGSATSGTAGPMPAARP